ncbi:MAG TPA: tetratricopeptide repeat protein [Tepidisphaeraceae bacterium]|nr:tetratricopeptide repeat protein [Tepidisphaeraceae bacterium]
MLHTNRRQFDLALAVLNRAVENEPNSADSHFNLGNVLLKSGRWTEAVERYDRVLAIQPNHTAAIINQAAVLRRLRQHDRSIASLRRVLAAEAGNFEAMLNLGSILMDVGRVSEAIEIWGHASALRPDHAACGSNRVYALRFDPRWDSAAILAEEKAWNRRHGEPLAGRIRPHGNDRDPGRRLRVGFISPNLNLHVVGRNLVPFFREYDRDRLELTAYSAVMEPDELSQQIRGQVSAWLDISRVPDETVAERIRADKIDVLFDLALHMAYNRLPILARKPAPVQVTFAGYPGGTGMPAMDWRLTDPYLDPPGETDGDYVEESWRLPHSFWCYDPSAMAADAPPVGPLPAMQAGYVTFGCLNNFCKVNEPTLLRWSRVMQAVPKSRLLLLTPEGESRRRVAEFLQSQSISQDRLSFVPLVQPHHLYMAEFNRIDIGLDTLPYNGHTTSLDSLWMGVPVVTRVGKTVGGRAGWSQLSNLNLAELAARDDENFVRIATELAGDLPRLAELRRTLRDRMNASPLTDAKGFTRGIEVAIRHVWEHWCANAG